MQYTDSYTPSHEYTLRGSLYLGSQGPVHKQNPCLSHTAQLAHHVYRTIQNQHTGSTPAATSMLWPAGLALGAPPPQPQSYAHENDRQQLINDRTTYTANPSEQSRGCGSHLSRTPHCQRLTPPCFHRAESFPKMSQWQAQSLALTRTPGFFM